MDLQIKGKKAIMAGGSAGMGRATAERLAEAGLMPSQVTLSPIALVNAYTHFGLEHDVPSAILDLGFSFSMITIVSM